MKGLFTSLLSFLIFNGCLFAQVVQPSNRDHISAPVRLDGTNWGNDYILNYIDAPIVKVYDKYNNDQLQATPANDDCSNAISLTVDAACVSGTNVQASTQSGENVGCQTGADFSVWYKFTATSSSMFVEVDLTSSSGCYLGSAVWSGSCLPSTYLSWKMLQEVLRLTFIA